MVAAIFVTWQHVGCYRTEVEIVEAESLIRYREWKLTVRREQLCDRVQEAQHVRDMLDNVTRQHPIEPTMKRRRHGLV